MTPIDQLFTQLQKSTFRSRFHLSAKDCQYAEQKSLPVIMQHAQDFIDQRLAPAHPKNDGKQTPFRGHPVFTAQHATATCCRTCLEKWHRIPAGRSLNNAERTHVLAVIEHWLKQELESGR